MAAEVIAASTPRAHGMHRSPPMEKVRDRGRDGLSWSLTTRSKASEYTLRRAVQLDTETLSATRPSDLLQDTRSDPTS